MSNNCFIPFKSVISDYWIPEKFPSPFLEKPHSLCNVAVYELQNYLKNPIDWDYDFGLNQPAGSLRIGKMFGVLVVRNQDNELGYLAAFSGKLANKNHHQKFVPPVFDSLADNSFLNVGMAELNEINEQIKSLGKAPEWIVNNLLFDVNKRRAKIELEEMKLELKQRKIDRDKQRKAAKKELPIEQFNLLNIELNRASTSDRQTLKKLSKRWKLELDKNAADLKETGSAIHLLKEQRKNKSHGLQQQLFESYQFLNHTGNYKSLRAIFKDAKPVSGAGECAAPKLLQYAFLHQFKPIALAEFWWGKSPKSAIRQHGHFYPPCEEKCRPILGYMLDGLL